ncbi:MAG: hypothetical protein ACLFP9_05805 [Desulfonatronovibrio sp.]
MACKATANGGVKQKKKQISITKKQDADLRSRQGLLDIGTRKKVGVLQEFKLAAYRSLASTPGYREDRGVFKRYRQLKEHEQRLRKTESCCL